MERLRVPHRRGCVLRPILCALHSVSILLTEMATATTLHLANDIIARLEAVATADAPIRLPLAPHEKGRTAVLKRVVEHFKDVGTIGIPPGDAGVLLFTPIPVLATTAALPIPEHEIRTLADAAAQLVVMGAQDYHCACGIACATAADMHTHLREHHAIQPLPATVFHCAECNSQHSTRDLLVKHVQEAHPPSYQCPRCAQLLDTREQLVSHALTVHAAPPTPTPTPTLPVPVGAGPSPVTRCLWWSGRINTVGTRCSATGTHKVKGGWVCIAHACECGCKARPGCSKCDECNRQGSKKAALVTSWPCRTCSRVCDSAAELETHSASGCSAAYFARKRKALEDKMDAIRKAKKQRTQ